MGVIYNNPKSIIYENLVLHIDPPNKHCIAEGDRDTTYFSTNDVKDMTNNVAPQVKKSSDATSYHYPEWHNSNKGCIEFTMDGAGSSGTYYKYGYFDLGSPVVGVTQFGENGCYTLDFWWSQKSLDADDIHQGMQLLGPRETLISYSSFSTREERWGSFTVELNGYSLDTSPRYVFRFKAGREKNLYGYWPDTVYNQNQFEKAGGNIYDFGADAWHHHCAVFDLGDSLGGGEKLYVYQDGTLIGTASRQTEGDTDPGTWAENTQDGGNIYLGASSRNDGTATGGDNLRSNGAAGYMGAFKIYNKALNADQVLQNYNALKWRYM